MLGLPLEVITMLGSSLFSGIMTMMSNNRKHQFELMKAAITQQKEDTKNQIQQMKVDKGFAFTRRVIALTVVGVTAMILLAPAVFNVPTVIPVQDTTELLFGLFNDTVTKYITVEGFVLPEWWSTAFTSIIGLYFGHSMVK